MLPRASLPEHPPRNSQRPRVPGKRGPIHDGKGDVGLNLVLGTPCLASSQPWVSPLSPSRNAVLRMQLCCCWQSGMTPGCSEQGGTAGVEQPRS